MLIFLIDLQQNRLAQLHRTNLYQLSFNILNDHFSCIFCLTLMTQQQNETCSEPYLQVRIEKSEMSRQKMNLFEVENIKYFRCYCPFREKNTSPKAQRTQELGTLAVLSSLTHSTIFV